MKKLLTLILIVLSISIYSQEEEVVYYDISSVSYKIAMEQGDVVWSEWSNVEWKARIDYFEKQQTVTIFNNKTEFYVINTFVDSTTFDGVLIMSFTARNEINEKIIIEFMILNSTNEFFILIENKKTKEIAMYKIE